MQISPDERGVDQCWVVEDELSFSIAADGQLEVGAYGESGMPANGRATLTKKQMFLLAAFLTQHSNEK